MLFRSNLIVADDLSLKSDGSVLNFGADDDVTLTHQHNTGLLLNKNLIVTGDLTVNGITTTIDTENFKVKDPIIILGKNNDTSDTLDIGFYGFDLLNL